MILNLPRCHTFLSTAGASLLSRTIVEQNKSHLEAGYQPEERRYPQRDLSNKAHCNKGNTSLSFKRQCMFPRGSDGFPECTSPHITMLSTFSKTKALHGCPYTRGNSFKPRVRKVLNRRLKPLPNKKS